MNNVINAMEKVGIYFSKKYNQATVDSENGPVIKFLNSLSSDNKLSYLEVGSGLGNFVDIVGKMNKFNVTCLEINPELAKITESLGYKTVNVNILNNDFKDEEFDIVHCSHVIEHLSYPFVVKALDELIRVTKKGGYIILRSPLMSPDFFTSINHIRPYPPKAIFDFYSNPQQQVTGKFKIKKVKEIFRKEAILVCRYSDSRLALSLNLIMKIFWLYFRFPFAKPNGYTLILKRQ